MKHTMKVGDWVKPKGGALPGRGCIAGRVVAIGTYSRLDIPAFLVDGLEGEAKPELVPQDTVEYWFTPEEVVT